MVISNQAASVDNSYPVNGNETSGNAVFSGSVVGCVVSGGTPALSSGSGNTYNSRRSSYSPSDRSRGRDSIAFTHGGEMPVAVTPWHRSILILFEVPTSILHDGVLHVVCFVFCFFFFFFKMSSQVLNGHKISTNIHIVIIFLFLF